MIPRSVRDVIAGAARSGVEPANRLEAAAQPVARIRPGASQPVRDDVAHVVALCGVAVHGSAAEPLLEAIQHGGERRVPLVELVDSDPAGSIVFIRSADPGYDWLFNRGIAGLVTEHGGANSHMAIRAAEFGLPAAIGGAPRIAKALAPNPTYTQAWAPASFIAVTAASAASPSMNDPTGMSATTETPRA